MSYTSPPSFFHCKGLLSPPVPGAPANPPPIFVRPAPGPAPAAHASFLVTLGDLRTLTLADLALLFPAYNIPQPNGLVAVQRAEFARHVGIPGRASVRPQAANLETPAQRMACVSEHTYATHSLTQSACFKLPHPSGCILMPTVCKVLQKPTISTKPFAAIERKQPVGHTLFPSATDLNLAPKPGFYVLGTRCAHMARAAPGMYLLSRVLSKAFFEIYLLFDYGENSAQHFDSIFQVPESRLRCGCSRIGTAANVLFISSPSREHAMHSGRIHNTFDGPQIFEFDFPSCPERGVGAVSSLFLMLSRPPLLFNLTPRVSRGPPSALDTMRPLPQTEGNADNSLNTAGVYALTYLSRPQPRSTFSAPAHAHPATQGVSLRESHRTYRIRYVRKYVSTDEDPYTYGIIRRPSGARRRSAEAIPTRSGPSRQRLSKFAEIRLDTDRITYTYGDSACTEDGSRSSLPPCRSLGSELLLFLCKSHYAGHTRATNFSQNLQLLPDCSETLHMEPLALASPVPHAAHYCPPCCDRPENYPGAQGASRVIANPPAPCEKAYGSHPSPAIVISAALAPPLAAWVAPLIPLARALRQPHVFLRMATVFELHTFCSCEFTSRTAYEASRNLRPCANAEKKITWSISCSDVEHDKYIHWRGDRESGWEVRIQERGCNEGRSWVQRAKPPLKYAYTTPARVCSSSCRARLSVFHTRAAMRLAVTLRSHDVGAITGDPSIALDHYIPPTTIPRSVSEPMRPYTRTYSALRSMHRHAALLQRRYTATVRDRGTFAAAWCFGNLATHRYQHITAAICEKTSHAVSAEHKGDPSISYTCHAIVSNSSGTHDSAAFREWRSNTLHSIRDWSNSPWTMGGQIQLNKSLKSTEKGAKPEDGDNIKREGTNGASSSKPTTPAPTSDGMAVDSSPKKHTVQVGTMVLAWLSITTSDRHRALLSSTATSISTSPNVQSIIPRSKKSPDVLRKE
ncbi:hypothetical protein K438DRAFT_1769554 [Mycena galopus ATCC 62051]|nr:hypothetical protein K438DRAFT_1769554 [Mycena galopus ATCC 62051]